MGPIYNEDSEFAKSTVEDMADWTEEQWRQYLRCGEAEAARDRERVERIKRRTAELEEHIKAHGPEPYKLVQQRLRNEAQCVERRRKNGELVLFALLACIAGVLLAEVFAICVARIDPRSGPTGSSVASTQPAAEPAAPVGRSGDVKVELQDRPVDLEKHPSKVNLAKDDAGRSPDPGDRSQRHRHRSAHGAGSITGSNSARTAKGVGQIAGVGQMTVIRERRALDSVSHAHPTAAVAHVNSHRKVMVIQPWSEDEREGMFRVTDAIKRSLTSRDAQLLYPHLDLEVPIEASDGNSETITFEACQFAQRLQEWFDQGGAIVNRVAGPYRLSDGVCAMFVETTHRMSDDQDTTTRVLRFECVRRPAGWFILKFAAGPSTLAVARSTDPPVLFDVSRFDSVH